MWGRRRCGGSVGGGVEGGGAELHGAHSMLHIARGTPHLSGGVLVSLTRLLYPRTSSGLRVLNRPLRSRLRRLMAALVTRSSPMFLAL